MKRLLRITFALLCISFAAADNAYVFASERIETVAAEAKATPVRGGIELSAPDGTRFEIYSITGQQIKTLTTSAETQTVELPKGCYIVRCPQWSKKVVVK